MVKGSKKDESTRLDKLRQSKHEELTKKRKTDQEAEDKDNEEMWGAAISQDDMEADKAKIKRIPQMPSQKEIDEHMVTHVPFRNWCEFCVFGKARDDPHRRKKTIEKY